MLLSGCVIDLTALPPYSVCNIKSTEDISSVFANDSISFSFIENLFVQEAWAILQARVAEKKEKDLFTCKSCAERDNGEDNGEFKMIECEGCLEWYHYHCVGLRSTSKPNKWFCIACWG
ncbi:unnamed protein product [Lymnaea stagnalis]|uniref:PHD-type domain-containing protein n=1 Tax=Lymnaea stagnalis TaxID=6523 RepID=A0AAV2H501_LYMST